MNDAPSEDEPTPLVPHRPEVARIASETGLTEVLGGTVFDPTIPTNPKLPADLRASAVSASRQRYYSASFTSPLPPPEILERYSMVPGALEQILRVLEKQQDHSHSMDREEMSITKQESLGAIEDARAGRQQARVGQWASVIICIASFVASGAICIYGASEYAFFAGGAIGIGALATIVATLVTGRPPAEGKKALPAEAANVYSDKALPTALPASSGDDNFLRPDRPIVEERREVGDEGLAATDQ